MTHSNRCKVPQTGNNHQVYIARPMLLLLDLLEVKPSKPNRRLPIS
jgi:hypothetical protein